MREEALAAGTSVAFETVFSTDGKLDFLRRAKRAGYFSVSFSSARNVPKSTWSESRGALLREDTTKDPARCARAGVPEKGVA
jgi:hypothetical protein